MSVQVSKKKQVIFGLIVLVLILGIVEAAAHVWWSSIQNCAFEDDEIFVQYDKETKKRLCEDLYNLRVTSEGILPNQRSESVNINSEGFRGPDFSVAKPASTYRIVMLGGSTMFGVGASSDSTTIPAYVQQFLDDYDFGFNVEVINAGIQNHNSEKEYRMLSDKIIRYDPDLVIMYDGFNNLVSQFKAEEVKFYWESACYFGNQKGFDVIVSLQPLNGFGNKVLTEQEYIKSLIGWDNSGAQWITRRGMYDLYANTLPQLQGVCTNVVDLRNSFDDISGPIYWDRGHVSDKGNIVIAEKFVNLILPLVQNAKISPFAGNLVDDVQINKPSQDATNFLAFYKTPTMIANFMSGELSYKQATTEIDFEQEFTEYSFVGKDLSKSDISEIDFTGKYLISTNLSNQDLTNKDLSGATLKGANLTGANLSHQDLSGKELQGILLKNADLSYVNLYNTTIGEVQKRPINPQLTMDEVKAMDIYFLRTDPSIRADLSGANLKGANLTNAILDQINLSNADLTDVDISVRSLLGVNLSGVDLSNKDLKGTILFGANLSGANLSGTIVMGTNLEYANLRNADFSGAKFGNNIAIFDVPNEIARNLSDEEIIIQFYIDKSEFRTFEAQTYVDRSSDITKLILEVMPDLRNTDLTGANFANSNLEDARLDGAILDCLNHPICN